MWTNENEIQFFQSALQVTTPEQLFYNLSAGQFAYVPKEMAAEGQTLQSRNSHVGSFTEKWVKDLLANIAKKHNLFAVNGVECKEIGLTNRSEADLAFCTTDERIQIPSRIKLLFEIKMSIVSNYQYGTPNGIVLYGDHTTHRGIPSLLRSDSMLKAIGKAINIRVSGISSSSIPIVVLGNSPISSTYGHKVDFLKKAGVVQSFLSLSPMQPLGNNHIAQSQELGFQTLPDIKSVEQHIDGVLQSHTNYFSAMLSKPKLGEIIRVASTEQTDEARAEKFLVLVRSI